MMPRDLALKVLNSLDRDKRLPERHLERAFQQNPHMTKRDRAFAIHLVQGVFRWKLRLDWIIKQNVQFAFNKIEPSILNALRVALHQIFFMDRVPQSAAVNEAVKQVKAMGRGRAAGFVNGILREICRKKDQIAFPDRESEPVRYLSVFYSYPPWLVKRWIRELGVDSTERLLEAGNRIPALVIRTNRLKVDRPGLTGLLEEGGVAAKPTGHSPEGIILEGLDVPVNQLKAFKKGLFQVQGEAAQICSHLLAPRPGGSVLDLCAGLGGKATHVAELMEGKGRILALDINHNRLIRLLENSKRLGIDCIDPVVADARYNLSFLVSRPFGKILVDGPCSGLGILSRHPDGKWSRGESDIARLSLLQTEILNGAVPLLIKGGKLLYVTCTISREENEDVVNEFLRRNSKMVLENLKDYVPDWSLEFIDDQGFFKTYPHVHGMDGFFAALFEKRA